MPERLLDVDIIREGLQVKIGQKDFVVAIPGHVELPEDQVATFDSADAILTFLCPESTNSVLATLGSVIGKELAPNWTEHIRSQYALNFGRTPQSSAREFGNPTALRAFYLGHPDRRTVSAVTGALVEPMHDPLLVLPERLSNGSLRAVVWSSEVFSAQFKVPSSELPTGDHPNPVYCAKGLFFGEVGVYSGLEDGPFIRVSLATTDANGVTRIDRVRDWVNLPTMDKRHSYNRLAAIERFAELSLFAHRLHMFVTPNTVIELSVVERFMNYMRRARVRHAVWRNNKEIWEFVDSIKEGCKLNLRPILEQDSQPVYKEEVDRLDHFLSVESLKALDSSH